MESLLLFTPREKLALLGPAPLSEVRMERQTAPALSLVSQMFNDAALSPWTHLSSHALLYLQTLVTSHRIGAAEAIDLLARLLTQLGRHLTAYDLVTFHHRGANYPDALLLDEILHRYLWYLEHNRDLFTGSEKEHRLRRRALRQACFLRRFYEGHPVPDEPTSPGENTRVLP